MGTALRTSAFGLGKKRQAMSDEDKAKHLEQETQEYQKRGKMRQTMVEGQDNQRQTFIADAKASQPSKDKPERRGRARK